MHSEQLDLAEMDRIESIFARFRKGDVDRIDALFRSERVHNEIGQDKVVIPSFNIEKIFSILPFAPKLYVCICPACIDAGNFKVYQEFVSRGLIVPILQASYRYYPEEVVAFSWKYDHLSRYEYNSFRYISMPVADSMNFCAGCAAKMFETMEESVRSRRNEKAYLHNVNAIRNNAYPF